MNINLKVMRVRKTRYVDGRSVVAVHAFTHGCKACLTIVRKSDKARKRRKVKLRQMLRLTPLSPHAPEAGELRGLISHLHQIHPWNQPARILVTEAEPS